mgnify:CR=1 FL=1
MINVKYKVFKIIFIILIVILFSLATFFLIKGLLMEKEDKGKSDSAPSVSSVDVEKAISAIKSEHGELLYESEDIPEFTSLAFKENDRIESYIIDTSTGEELKLEDIIKSNKMDDFLKKEMELLNLKYPEFIVEGIQNSGGEKVYLIKSNELLIYYYDYTYEYDYQEVVSLTINYNEVHEFLDFTHLLDSEYTNEDGYQYSKDKKTVAITFDDGPSSKYNRQFLDALAKNKAHGTFFMVGTMMQSCQKCVKDTYESGSEVASHTYNHINMTRKSIEDVNASIKKTDDLFYQITGDHIKYVRPPYGSYNKTNLENVDYPLILWNLDTEDWRYKDVDHIVNYVMENVSDGSIILMHELYETSLEALEIILPKLYAEGYQVVSVGELAELKGREVLSGHAYRSLKS